ncbi:MAG: methyl-accepting chemotaxis protein [Caulobacteraceae bacterium]|nr:methyl-accepting chemotaxis protein [Caulobacteraceae bacterium]
MDAAASHEASAVIQMLEAVRTKLEDRFIQAGDSMATALEAVEALIQSLDSLNGVLEGDSATGAHNGLQAAAADLLTLPVIQAERRVSFETLVQRSERLGVYIEQMRRTLRYLRAFALNLKVTAAAAPEFAGFAQEMMERIALGAQKLSMFSEQLERLDEQLRQALGFVCALEADCEQVLPSVVTALQSSAEAIQSHNREINGIATQVAELARQIRKKVGAALLAMQIGDNTRQRIEHVQAGLGMIARDDGPLAELDAGARKRASDTVQMVLLEQLGDLTDIFTNDAQKVTDNLLGLSDDARDVLHLKTKIGEGRTAGFLRDLETSVGEANGVVDQVRSVNGQAERAGRAAATAVETLLANVDDIRSVKTEIQYMAFNTSLRCARMGEAGRPLDVIALELRTGANQLGAAADNSMSDLDGLAEVANRIVAHDTGADVGQELDTAVQSIRGAGDAAESNLDAVGRQSADVAGAMDQLGANADFHGDLCTALEDAYQALAQITGPPVEEAAQAAPALITILNDIFKLYTMNREREIHHAASPQGVGDAAAVPEPAAELFEEAEDEDALFASALF